ncbi:MAG: DNA phosphorothioation system sulfurtransferase DndC [Candidatus Methanomethylophilaceae archaeon]|jgi:DNA sulfur modification protein DndC
MSRDIDIILEEMRLEYISNDRPWIVGFSGGKDSTMIVQLVFEMLSRLNPEHRNKKIFILSTNTMVESPPVIKRLKKMCLDIENMATSKNYPVEIKLLRPNISDTFWVNVIGRGYPAPNRWFRWCTSRLKIDPMNKYILNNVRINGEVCILLGTRKSESKARAESMTKHEISGFHLRKHNSISGAFIYAPIEDLTEDEVWNFLLRKNTGWYESNIELYHLYKGENSEIDFMIDGDSASSGHSRFGCWTCTVVEVDKALQSLINEGHEEYLPLLEFRNSLKMMRDNPDCREKHRRNQRLDKFYDQYYNKTQELDSNGFMVLGPFTLKTRHYLLKKLLEIQDGLRETEPDIELISDDEITLIKMAWVYDGDTSDAYALGDGFTHGNTPEERLLDNLLAVEKDFSTISRRVGVYKKLEQVISEFSMNKMVEDKNDNR